MRPTNKQFVIHSDCCYIALSHFAQTLKRQKKINPPIRGRCNESRDEKQTRQEGIAREEERILLGLFQPLQNVWCEIRYEDISTSASHTNHRF